METEEMIAIKDFCSYHNIELSFIYTLHDSGLLDMATIEDVVLVPVNQLKQLELMLRLKKEMDINTEGIETISYLLDRIRDLQQRIILLNNRLAFYEV